MRGIDKAVGSKDFDRARDELFSHIHRCGALRAAHDQQIEWMADTVEYMAECFPALTREELGELRTIGLRFCSPVVDNVQDGDVPAGADEGLTGTEAAAA